MIRLGSINTVLKTLIEPPATTRAASEPVQASSAQTLDGQDSIDSSAFSSQLSLTSESGPSEAGAPAAPTSATDGAPAADAAATSEQPARHPQTALLVLAPSGQVYASASTLSTPSPPPQSTSLDSTQAPTPLNGFFAPQHPSSLSSALAALHAADEDDEDNPQHVSNVVPSLVGDERMRVLAGLATLSWREHLMQENPRVPLVVLTELGLVLIQPLSGSGAAGAHADGIAYSSPSSPRQDDNPTFANLNSTSASSTPMDLDPAIQRAQRRRAASLRASRLLLVLNTVVELRPEVGAALSAAEEEPAQVQGEDAAQPTEAGAEAKDEQTTQRISGEDTDGPDVAVEPGQAMYAAETETLISVASAGAQFLGPALASIAQA